MKRMLGLGLILVVCFGSTAWADGFIVPMPPHPDGPLPPNLSIKYHHVDIQIDNQVARTTVDQVFINNYHRDIEGTYIFPIPQDASISKFSMFMGGEEVRGKILDRDEARRIYQDIVRQRKDPALLEYFKDGMFKASVYPIPANGETRIKLDYSEVLKLSGGICGYRYTLSTEKFSRDPLQSVKVNVKINSKVPMKTIYSPSHDIKIEKQDDYHATVSYVEEGTRPDKDFLLYYTVSEKDIGFNLLPYRDEDNQGYFLAMISPQVKVEADKTSSKNIIFVLDTSGSMKGEKINQAKGALSFCLNSLNKGDRFNLIDFDDGIKPFKTVLIRADADNVREALSFVDGTEADGGTNINEALLTALQQIERAEGPSFIIFLTDGLPTVGETNINNILTNIKNANKSSTRLFVFGVGYDVNTRLLDRLAQDNFATSDYVRPSEDIEVKVSAFYKKVSHPVLTDLKLSFGQVEVYDLYPRELPDIFKGTQLLVLGKYKNDNHTAVTLTGSAQGSTQRFTYEVDFTSDGQNDFIPRLWATRRIGYLIDQLRLHGQNQELVEEVVSLSKKYGIITEYTSFLVDADYRLAVHELAPQAKKGLEKAALDMVGAGAVDRSKSSKAYIAAPTAPQGYLDAEGKEQRIERIDQIGNRTFFNKNGLWVDSQYEGKTEPIKVKAFSEAYFKLLDRVPEVSKYLALGDEIIFLLHGKAIQISDQGKEDFTESELNLLVSP
jgi:uncharacterized protein YegL